MPSNDAEIFNTLERAESTDLGDLQAIGTRVLSDVVRYGQVLRFAGLSGDTARNIVVGGLTVAPSGADVVVAPGALAQNSGALVPLPGPLDSTYRLSRLDVAATVVMAAPGVTTFYLLEAQMKEVVTLTQPRDIWTPPAGPFIPAVVNKQVQHQVAFQVTAGAGGNAPAPSGGDWVPLAIVRRPAGGGAVLASDIVDVRPLAESGRERPLFVTPLMGSLVCGAVPSNLARVVASVDGPLGVLAYGNTAVDLTAADVLSPVTALVANGWFFVYLAPWSAVGLTPRTVAGGVPKAGVLVVSDVTPTTERQNSANVDLPAPFGVTPALAGFCYLVGAVRRNAANTGWACLLSTDLREFVYDGGAPNQAIVAQFVPPVLGVNTAAPAANIVPVNVQRYRMSTRWDGTAGAPSVIQFQARPAGGAAVFGATENVDDSLVGQHAPLDVSARAWGGGNAFDFDVAAGVPDIDSAATLTLTGFWY